MPKEFQPLLRCISPSAFKVVDWQSLLAEAPGLTRRFLRQEGVGELKKSLETLLPEQICFAQEGSTQGKEDFASAAQLGESLLELYFLQIFNPRGLFLDLRSQGFKPLPSGLLLWSPNGLWVQWQEPFRQGLVKIYRGYYGDQSSLLREGLEEVGLIRHDFPPQKVQEVESMLLQHIGGQTEGQRFSVEHFTQSFERLFLYLLDNKIRLSPDFLFLGVYLASLYLHLESLDAAYNVRRSFERAEQRVFSR